MPDGDAFQRVDCPPLGIVPHPGEYIFKFAHRWNDTAGGIKRQGKITNPLDRIREGVVEPGSELRNSIASGGPSAPDRLGGFFVPGSCIHGRIPALDLSSPGAVRACPTRKGKDASACSVCQVSNPRSLDSLESVHAPAISANGVRS